MISVILPHFNQPAALRRALHALAGQVRAHGAEVIVVDNGSAPDQRPEPVLADFPEVRLLHQCEPGPGPARNLGVVQSRGEVLAFIDSDCVAAPDWLDAVCAGIAAGARILGGDVRILYADPAQPTRWEAFEAEYGYRNQHYIRDKDFIATCNLAMHRAVFDQVGGFAGIDLAEDMDWGRRAVAAGYRLCWRPEMRVYHPARRSFAALARKWDRMTGHEYLRLRARPWGRLRWGARALAMAFSPLVEVPRIACSRRIAGGMKGRMRAFGGLWRIRLYRAWLMGALLWGRDGAQLARRWRARD